MAPADRRRHFSVHSGVLFALGLVSVRDDRRDPAIARQVAKQSEETEQFMREPFQPESGEARSPRRPSPCSIRSPLPERRFTKTNRAMPATARTASGTDAGPKLVGATAQKSAENFGNFCDIPLPKMIEGEMKPVDS